MNQPVEKIIASVEAQNNGEQYATYVKVHQHTFIADEPPGYGGKDLGPAPTDYLCAALASCTAMTLRMYAQRKQWPVQTIKVVVNLVKAAGTTSGNHVFSCEVQVSGALNEEQHKRLMDIAKACPIHRLLIRPNEVKMVRK